MRSKLTVLGLVLVLSFGAVGCKQIESILPGINSSHVVDVSVATVENSLTLALISAKVYTDLPRCGTGPKICSDREVVRQIRQYAIKAHDAVVMARHNQHLIGAAVSAVGMFNSIVPKS